MDRERGNLLYGVDGWVADKQHARRRCRAGAARDAVAVVAFEDPTAAFAFAVSLELAGAPSAGTLGAPADMPLHVLPAGASAFDFAGLASASERACEARNAAATEAREAA